MGCARTSDLGSPSGDGADQQEDEAHDRWHDAEQMEGAPPIAERLPVFRIMTMGTSTTIVTTRVTANKRSADSVRKNVAGCVPNDSARTGVVDTRDSGSRIVMAGAMLRFRRLRTGRNSSGVKVAIDRVSASHGPQYMPPTNARIVALTTSKILSVI